MVSYFSKKDLNEIAEAIRQSELQTSGEIRVHIARQIKGEVLGCARKVFSKLEMHRTQEHNGVLIFISMSGKEFAILGDQGIHERVGDTFWGETRDAMLNLFKEGKIKEGVIAGVLSAGKELKKYFPRCSDDVNELSNEVSTRG